MWRFVAVSVCFLLSLTGSMQVFAAPGMPALEPLRAEDIRPGCGCRFGVEKGVSLVYWSWEDDKRHGVIRDETGLKTLTLYNEKYFPAQHEPPQPRDQMVLQVANGEWSVQAVSEVMSACTPKAKRCAGTEYRSKLILQWRGKHRHDMVGWGHCGCN